MIVHRCLRFWSLILFTPFLFSFGLNAQAHQSTTTVELTQTYSTHVTYCIDPNWAPYEALRNGRHIGISAEYIKIISELSGIKFTLVPTESWEQSLDFVQDGTCQLVAMLNISDFRKQFLDFSEPYFEAPNVLVARSGTPVLQGYGGVGNRLVGVVKGYRNVEYISRYYPELRLKLLGSEKEALSALALGEIDVMVGSLMSVNSYINNQKMDNLEVVGYAEPFDSLGFGVNKAYSHIIPALNDAIRQIPESKKVEIYKQWNNVQVRYKREYFKLTASVIIVLLIIIGWIWRNRTVHGYENLIVQKNSEIESLQTTLLDRNRTLEFLSSHDTLTGLYNRNHMIQKAEEEICRFKRFATTPSLIVLEIEQDKNSQAVLSDVDRQDVLKYVAAQCLTIVREVDIVSRFSDEQFVILCPQTNIDEGSILATRLVNRLKHNNVMVGANLVVALGLSELNENESFPDWLERTTKALYQSKRLGYGVVSIAD